MQEYPDYLECIELLYSMETPETVINHSIFTCITALSISSRLKEKFDLKCDLIKSGSLLHDIGRSRSHNIDHGILGRQILKQKGYPDDLANICSIHLFAGITAIESVRFELPKQDYLPLTYEEKIIVHADNISKGDKILLKQEMENRFYKYLEKDDSIIKRTIELYEFIESLIKNV